MQITFKGDPIHTIGELPAVGSQAKDFILTKPNLTPVKLNDFVGKNLILNVFVSVDTPVCALSVTKFNQEASKLKNISVLCVSMDLPFALDRFCGAKDIRNVIAASSFRHPEFGKNYGLTIIDGPLSQLLSRAIIIIGSNNKIMYTEQVPEITIEPNYDAALKALG